MKYNIMQTSGERQFRFSGLASIPSATSDIDLLFQSIEQKDHALLRSLLKSGVDSNTSRLDGWTPLALACDLQDLPITTLLLEHGANYRAPIVAPRVSPIELDLLPRSRVRRLSDTTTSVLHIAARRGFLPGVRLLLQPQYRPFAGVYFTEPNPLELAIIEGHSEVVKELLSSFPELLLSSLRKTEEVDEANQRPTRRGDLEPSEGLIGRMQYFYKGQGKWAPYSPRQTVPDLPSETGAGTQDVETSGEEVDMGRVGSEDLLQHSRAPPASITASTLGMAPPISRPSGRDVVIPFADSEGGHGIVRRPPCPSSAIHAAITSKHEEFVPLLLRRGIDPNLQLVGSLSTPLHFACQSGSLDVVAELLHNGADPTLADTSGATPLHLLARRKNPFEPSLALGGSLIGEGSVSEGGLGAISQGVTASAGATRSGLALWEQNILDIAKLLVEYGASVSAPDYAGVTPLLLACESSNLPLVEFLLSHDADINCKDERHRTPVHITVHRNNLPLVKLLIERAAYLDGTDLAGETPLFSCVRQGSLRVLQMLLDAGANPDVRNNNDVPLLTMAVLLGKVPIVAALLKKVRNIDILDGNELTPLYHTCAAQNIDMVRLLVQFGANPLFKVNGNPSPVELARERGYGQILQVLELGRVHM